MSTESRLQSGFRHLIIVLLKFFWQERILTVHLQSKSRSRAAVARRAHNPKVGGSIPPFATRASKFYLLVFYCKTTLFQVPFGI